MSKQTGQFASNEINKTSVPKKRKGPYEVWWRYKKRPDQEQQYWKEGKIKSKDQTGKNNHMWGKKSWNNGKTYENKKLKGSKNGTSITVTLQNQFGEILIFPCLKEACEKLNLNYKCMLQVSRGKNKQHKGYIIISKISTHNRKEVPK